MKNVTGFLVSFVSFAFFAACTVGQSIPPPMGAPSVGHQVVGAGGLAPSVKETTTAEPRQVMDISARGPGKLGGLLDSLKKKNDDKGRVSPVKYIVRYFTALSLAGADKNPENEADRKSDRKLNSPDKEFVRRKGGGKIWKGKGGGGSGSAAAPGPEVPLFFLGFSALMLYLVV
ncbi:hypothetical protein EMCG_02118 [[Emmonsia] crescens]|uniref:Uncharacterized protein n=1 Tax=[Emmonsia] crescens TaxID=73230 RepID=A0A0G2J993_9EURO|nr:hypothetical protein EMCG_02118 [Emmonsia crescens UAMH 3008]